VLYIPFVIWYIICISYIYMGVLFELNDQILTVAQAAKYLQVCDRTVRRLIESKTLTASKVGHIWRIRQVDINEYLASNANNRSE